MCSGRVDILSSKKKGSPVRRLGIFENRLSRPSPRNNNPHVVNSCYNLGVGASHSVPTGKVNVFPSTTSATKTRSSFQLLQSHESN